jgi:hypothetical protein
VSEDLSLGELARTVESIRRDVREDLNEFGRRLDQLVLRDVYLADQRAATDRMNRLEQDVKDGRNEMTRQITEIKAEMTATKTRTLSIVATILTAASIIVAVIGYFVTK